MKKYEIRAVLRVEDPELKNPVQSFSVDTRLATIPKIDGSGDSFGVYEIREDGRTHVKDFPTYPLAVAFVLSQKRPFEAKWLPASAC